MDIDFIDGNMCKLYRQFSMFLRFERKDRSNALFNFIIDVHL